ncbi:hypothetical protein J6590_100828 [Homalodisca vitripennis]|nr:hypothetical protein J6590_100828 [Homalodisca vitripennis]
MQVVNLIKSSCGLEEVLGASSFSQGSGSIELGTFCVLGRRDNRYTTETALQDMKVRGIELGTFCVLGRRDNRYTTETSLVSDWKLSSSSSGGSTSTYKNNEQKEVKKSRRCHCTGWKSRAKITSTRITITHQTSTGYSGILTRMAMSAISSHSLVSSKTMGQEGDGLEGSGLASCAVTTPGLDSKQLLTSSLLAFLDLYEHDSRIQEVNSMTVSHSKRYTKRKVN